MRINLSKSHFIKKKKKSFPFFCQVLTHVLKGEFSWTKENVAFPDRSEIVWSVGDRRETLQFGKKIRDCDF